MTTTHHPKPGKYAINPKSAELAYLRAAAKIAAVPDSDCIPITVDIPSFVALVFATADRIDPLIPAMAELGRFDTEPVVELRTYGAALFHTYLVARRRPAPPAMIAEAVALKKDMLVSADPLVHFGHLDADRVAAIRAGGNGHVATAKALVELSMLFGESWEFVRERTCVTVAMVERAGELGLELLKRLGSLRMEEHPLAPVSPPKLTRNKAYALLVGAYRQARRAVEFLRWAEGDVDAIVPTIYTKQRHDQAADADETAPFIEVATEPDATRGGESN